MKGVLGVYSLIDLSRNIIPVRIINVNDKSKVIQKGGVVAICAMIIHTDRNHELSAAETSETLNDEL